MENNVENVSNAAMEQPLFQTETVVTKQEYVRYSRFAILNLNKLWLLMIICNLFVIITTVFRGAMLWEAVILVLILNPVIIIGNDVISKRAYKSNIAGKQDRSRFLFFHDRITEIREHGSDTYGYEKLLMIKETDKSFYIMVTRSNGMIILKSYCTPELIEFIRSVKTEYKK